MKLSIIIVSFNTKDLLKKCIESIVHCSWFNILGEIIVIDNGSTDGSQKVVKSIKSKVESNNLKMSFIENEQNLGFAKAVNQGIKQAKGEVIFLLNPDTVVKPEALKNLLEFEEKLGPAIVGARMLNPDGSIQGSVFNLPTIGGAIQEYWFGKKGAFSKYAPFGGKPVEVKAVSGGAMLISKEVIKKIGLFDERYFMYFEDLDYCRRARKAGFKIWYLPTAEVIHEHGASGKKLATPEDQWHRLVPSSKIYHGLVKHYLINLIICLSQKWQKFLKKS